jgi:hypothetical protein
MEPTDSQGDSGKGQELELIQEQIRIDQGKLMSRFAELSSRKPPDQHQELIVKTTADFIDIYARNMLGMVGPWSFEKYVDDVGSYAAQKRDKVLDPDWSPRDWERLECAIRARLLEREAQARERLLELGQRPAGESPKRPTFDLNLTGRTLGASSNEVIVADEAIRIGDKSFALLLALVAARFNSPDGWIHKQDLFEKGILVAKHNYKQVERLRKSLAKGPSASNAALVVETPGDGRIRLAVEAASIRVDKAALLQHGDRFIKEVASRLPGPAPIPEM